MLTAADIISKLELQPHPIEGGHFRETYRSPHSTAIYYLLAAGAVSEMHRLPGDELYHFYAGDPLETLLLKPGGESEIVILGKDRWQLAIPGGVWQGSTPLAGPHGFSLIGATMAPAFEYADYERGMRAVLVKGWPGEAERIEKRTPNG